MLGTVETQTFNVNENSTLNYLSVDLGGHRNEITHRRVGSQTNQADLCVIADSPEIPYTVAYSVLLAAARPRLTNTLPPHKRCGAAHRDS